MNSIAVIVTQSVTPGRGEVHRAPASVYGTVQFGPSNGCGDNSVSVVASGGKPCVRSRAVDGDAKANRDAEKTALISPSTPAGSAAMVPGPVIARFRDGHCLRISA